MKLKKLRIAINGSMILLFLASFLWQGAEAAITCTVRVAKLNLRAAPSTSAAIQTVLSANDPVSADARTQNGGRTWLRVTARQRTGWVDANLVQGCTFTTLPQVQPPTGGGNAPQPQPQPPAPFVVSYTPAPNAGGADNEALLIPRDARPGPDNIPVFREYVIFQLDPSRRAADNETRVESVEFRIEDDDSGDRIYRHTEGTAPYCVFANEGSTCNNIWFVAQTGGRWPQDSGVGMRPSNRRVDPSAIYRARMVVEYENGDSDNWDFRFRIIPPGSPASAAYLTPSLDSFTPNGDYQGEVRVQSDLVQSLDALVHYRDRLVFQLFVHNGSGRDGDGVGAVRFTITDSESGQPVYQHTERNRPYCVFGDGGSSCNTIWRLAETGFAWPASDPESGIPDGQPVQFEHEYSATMSVTDPNGNFVGEWSFYFDFNQ
jgi:hypothetical protein